MNLDNISEKVKDNFSAHIHLAKDSDFFTRYSNEFFQDFDIDSPFLTPKEMLNIMVDKFDSTANKLDQLGINLDNDTVKKLNSIFENVESPIAPTSNIRTKLKV